MRVACVSIDLDEISEYSAIHGLAPQTGIDPALVHRVAGERFGALCAAVGIRGTLFAIGRCLTPEGRAAATLRAACESGHEIGNHTLSHDYRLTRRDRPEIADEVEGGRRAIELAIGTAPAGFRAPGYHISRELMEVVAATGHLYDSSVMPSLAYVAARAVAIGAMRLAGRRSVSMPDGVREAFSPWKPHASPAAPALLELPVSAAPGLPFIGTAVTMLPAGAVRAAYRLLRRRTFLNLELHGIDLMDTSDGVPSTLTGRQPGLRKSAASKAARLREVLSWIASDYEVLTLAGAADRTLPSVRPAH